MSAEKAPNRMKLDVEYTASWAFHQNLQVFILYVYRKVGLSTKTIFKRIVLFFYITKYKKICIPSSKVVYPPFHFKFNSVTYWDPILTDYHLPRPSRQQFLRPSSSFASWEAVLQSHCCLQSVGSLRKAQDPVGAQSLVLGPLGSGVQELWLEPGVGALWPQWPVLPLSDLYQKYHFHKLSLPINILPLPWLCYTLEGFIRPFKLERWLCTVGNCSNQQFVSMIVMSNLECVHFRLKPDFKQPPVQYIWMSNGSYFYKGPEHGILHPATHIGKHSLYYTACVKENNSLIRDMFSAIIF